MNSNISTKNVGKSVISSNKREKQLTLQKHHAELFRRERVNNPKFIPRICYSCDDKLVFGLFDREIRGGKDIYIEFTNRDYVPEDSQRTLWKWIYNDNHKTEYVKGDPHASSGDQMTLIPVTELVNVSRYHDPDKQRHDEFKPLLDVTPKIIAEKKQEKVEEVEETPPAIQNPMDYTGIHVLDLAAIIWKKPVGVTPALNTLINKHFK